MRCAPAHMSLARFMRPQSGLPGPEIAGQLEPGDADRKGAALGPPSGGQYTAATVSRPPAQEHPTDDRLAHSSTALRFQAPIL